MEAGSAESRNNTNQNIILGVSRINLASVVAYNAVTHSRCKRQDSTQAQRRGRTEQRGHTAAEIHAHSKWMREI